MHRTAGVTAAGRKEFELSNADCYEPPLSVTRLNGPDLCGIRRVIFLPEQQLLVAAAYDRLARVYQQHASDMPCAVFDKHTYALNDVAQLDTDLVVSVGSDNMLYSWRAATGEMVDCWQHRTSLKAVAKLDDSRVIVGDDLGEIVVLTHTMGRSFRVQQSVQYAHSMWIKDIVVHRNLIVSCSEDKKAKLWDSNSLSPLSTLRCSKAVNSAAVSEKSILTVCDDGNVYVHRNSDGFELDFMIRSGSKKLKAVAIINDDIVAVGGVDLSFISLSAKSYVSRTETDQDLASLLVLNGGRIAVSGWMYGYCAILSPPESVRQAVADRGAYFYSPFDTIAASSSPLRAAWVAVQDGQITHVDACMHFITCQNCAASFDQWCVAHHMLMEAVKCGEISGSRHYGEGSADWCFELYQHSATLPMGEKYIGFMKSLFKEAADNGVIAESQVESLINSLTVRQDMDMDNRFVVNAVYQLFIRQTEADVRFRQIFHYHKVQQRTALVESLVAMCIIIDESMVTNSFSVGAAILNNSQVCGLTQSLLGVANDGSGGFVAVGLVNRVIGTVNELMRVEEWLQLPLERRKEVEESASNVGLSIDELRENLLCLTEMREADAETPPEQDVFHEVCENLHELHEDTRNEPTRPNDVVLHNTSLISTDFEFVGGALTPRATSFASVDGNDSELKLWKQRGVSKAVVAPLESQEAASCVAAFLVNYEAKSVEQFKVLKNELAEHFGRSCIPGQYFTDLDDEDKKAMVELVTSGLVGVTEDNLLVSTRIGLKKFIRHANK